MRGVKDYYDAYSKSLNPDPDRISWDVTPQFQKLMNRVDHDRNEFASVED